MIRSNLKGLIGLVAAVLIVGSVEARAQSTDWNRVDTLTSGTRIVVTLRTGEKRVATFRRATADDLTVARKKDATDEEALSKSLIASVATHDPVRDGVLRGALSGFGGLTAMGVVALSACGTGCESGGHAELAMSLFGAGIGSLIGWIADRDNGRSEILFPASSQSRSTSPPRASRFFPGRPTVRFGPMYTQTAFRSPRLDGKANAPGFGVAVQVSPHLSAHIEYISTRSRFAARPGDTPDEVLQNIVPTYSRTASGFPLGVESRQIKYVFTQLVGVNPSPWRRVRVEFVGGLGVQAKETRDYYPAFVVANAQPAQSSSPRFEVFVSVGWGQVMIGPDDGNMAGRPNIGGGLALRPWPRIGVEIDVCRNVNRTGDYGSVSVVSGNVSYFFLGRRVQPYVTGGIGGFWSSERVYLFRENTTFAWNAGGGAVVPVTAHLSLRPEFRVFVKSELQMYRPSLALGYAW